MLGQRIKLLTLLALSCLSGSCALSDIRPEELRGVEPTAEREQRGRELLGRALDASGGSEAWRQIASAELILEDEWRGFIGWLFRPWPSNPTQLAVRYDLGMRAAQAGFLGEKRHGETWGRDGEGTWSQKPGDERVYKKRESVRFILGAYQYFFELAPRIAEAPIVLYAGSRERDGRRYELVFATWERQEPHKEHDQYLLWIADDTGRIEIAQYTIRDKFRFATGVNFFSDFREVDGLTLPHAYWIVQHLDDEKFVHRVQLEDVHLIPADPGSQ